MSFFRITVLVVATWVAIAESKSVKDLIRSPDDTADLEDDELDPRVLGGRDAEEGEFPYLVSLHYKKRFICSSFLITPRILMTAAHCVVFEDDEPEDPKHYTGFVGTLNRDGPEQKIKFDKIVAPPEYGYDTEYDIALMTLSEPVQLNDKIQTVCLPSNNSVYENTTAQVVGWGVTEQWGTQPAKILQTATENVPTYEMCEFTYGVLGIPVTRRHICAGGEKDKGVCFGDSGSPLIFNATKPVAIGIVSFGSFRGCGIKHIPAVCTATAMYTDWILENMGDDAKDLCFVDRNQAPTADPVPSPAPTDGQTVGR